MKAHVDREREPVIAELLDDDGWNQLRQDGSRAARVARGQSRHCWCVECGWPMHPKQVSHTGTRFFAHNQGNPSKCSQHDGESEEHRRLKMDIFRAISSVPGWTAGVEERTDEVDPDTGAPARVDVVAFHSQRRHDRSGRLGFEVQLSRIGDGKALDRHAIRERWMERCAWVTRTRPSWGERLPWYLVDRSPEGRREYFVLEGAVTERPVPEGGTDYFDVPAFPAQQMVRQILRGRTRWVEGLGWVMSDSVGGRRHRRGERMQGRREALEDHCYRLAAVPPFAEVWSEAEWLRYAFGAHERRRTGGFLTELDRIAFVRYPFLDPSDVPPGGLPTIPYDHLTMTLPCTCCGQLVIVTCDPLQPLHHRCEQRQRHPQSAP